MRFQGIKRFLIETTYSLNAVIVLLSALTLFLSAVANLGFLVILYITHDPTCEMLANVCSYIFLPSCLVLVISGITISYTCESRKKSNG